MKFVLQQLPGTCFVSTDNIKCAGIKYVFALLAKTFSLGPRFGYKYGTSELLLLPLKFISIGRTSLAEFENIKSKCSE